MHGAPSLVKKKRDRIQLPPLNLSPVAFRSPEHNGHRKGDAKGDLLPECLALQGKLAAEALELADPVEDLEEARHHDARK